MGYMSMFKDYRNTLMKALCSSKDIVNLLKNTMWFLSCMSNSPL